MNTIPVIDESACCGDGATVFVKRHSDYVLLPFLACGEVVDGELTNRRIDFERYEELLGHKVTGNPAFVGRYLLLTPNNELVNMDTRAIDSVFSARVSGAM